MERFDLEKQFTFYASYHSNGINKLIHMLCIWPILATATVFLAHANWSFLVLFVYVPWYIVLDYCAGTIAGVGICLMVYGANYWVEHSVAWFGHPAWHIALPIHLTCWILQFVGHGLFEKRAPALLDSLDQALITAPLFVFLELLIPLGYRKDFFQRIEKQVAINVQTFHSKKKL